MKKKKKLLWGFCLIVLTALLAVVAFYGRNKVLLNNLEEEVKILAKLDVGSDRYNRGLKTSGDYALVEKTIKEYMDEYAVLLQDTLKIKQDEKFTKILSYSNYEKDGPNFEESLNYLALEKTNFNDNIAKLLDMSKEEAIIKYGEDRITDEYYLSLYKELILSDDLKNNFWSTSADLVTTRDDVNRLFDQSTEALNLLVANQKYWKLEDGEIKIMSQTLYDQYMAIINGLNK
ncbi:MAG: hypothetical protein IJI22_03930 [Bacilli bacterium]|nr:hypothetical protein [Bacilli bacterium]